MSRISQLSGNRLSGEQRMFAYGFDAVGFPSDHGPAFVDGFGRIEFIDFYDSTSLEMADGVIIPQGIFERIESRRSTFGPRTDVPVHKTLLLERERQIFNLLRANRWVCFLVGDIVDEVSQGIHLESIHDTDLCKRILNAFIIERRHRYRIYVGTPRHVRASEPEFESYVRAYGTPTTVFELPHLQPFEKHVIVEFGDQTVGFEIDTQLFFLPFHSHEKNEATALSAAQTVARAISEYRRNRVVEIPHWVDELKFKNEEALYLEINSLLEKVNRLECQLLSWKDYKGILTTSGKQLGHRIVEILESVFDLKVDFEEQRESGFIRNDSHRPALLIETQSAERNVEKAFIDQIYSHRQSSALPESLPAVLFINSDMSIREVAKRADARVPEEVISYAKERNVLIVRTIDLLLLMRKLENDPHKGSKIMHLLLSGGGWLKTDLAESY